MIFQRHELKYRITRGQMELLCRTMESEMKPDKWGHKTIQSLYLDTPSFLLARRSMEHPLYKEKLRLRSYDVASPEDEVFLELKKKYRSVVYKRRLAMEERTLEQYLATRQPPVDSQIMREIQFCFQRYPDLSPRILLSYERDAFYARHDHEFRVTFDTNVLWRAHDLTLTSGIYGTPLIGADDVLMEIKTLNTIPLWMVQLLSQQQIRKASFSKYGTAYQILSTYPDSEKEIHYA